MEKLDYHELINLLKNGDISVQDPVMVYDSSGNTSKKCPFEQYLQEYEGFDDKNSLEKLHGIYDIMRTRVNELEETPEVKSFVINLNNQWIEPDRQLHVEDVIPEDFFQKQGRGVGNYERACGLCDRVDGNCPKTPESSFTGKHPLEREADGVIDLCGQVREYLEDNMEDIKKMLIYFRGFDSSLFLDLSQRHKSLYFPNDTPNDIIPNNIHIIFSNFLLLHNMFTKQLIQYYKYLHGLLEELDEKCSKMNALKDSVHVDQYDLVKVLSNLLGFNKEDERDNLDEEEGQEESGGEEEQEDKRRGKVDLNEALEVQDYSDDDDGVVDDDYDGVDETYDDDFKEDDLQEDGPDLKGKKEIEMIIESDDENSVASSFY
jgi:hypothetical protein